MKLAPIFCLSFFILILSACQQTKPNHKPTEGGLSPEQVEGKWLIVSMKSDTKEHEFTNYPEFGLIEGKMSLVLKVNSCGGQYTLLKNQIKIEKNTFCTEKCCDTKEEQELAQLLAGTWTCTRDENWMTWSIKEGNKEIKFLKQTDKQLSLSEWSVVRMTPTADAEHIFEKDQYKMRFSNQNSIRIQLAKNHCVASFTQKENKLTFLDYIGCTRGCCDTDEANQLKNYFTNQTLEFSVNANKLILKNSNIELEFARTGK